MTKVHAQRDSPPGMVFVDFFFVNGLLVRVLMLPRNGRRTKQTMKFLFVGDITTTDKLAVLAEKVRKLNAKKHSFAAVFAVGEFSASECGAFPVPLYVCGSTRQKREVLWENVSMLNSSGVSEICGLLVAHVAGTYNAQMYRMNDDARDQAARLFYGREEIAKNESGTSTGRPSIFFSQANGPLILPLLSTSQSSRRRGITLLVLNGIYRKGEALLKYRRIPRARPRVSWGSEEVGGKAKWIHGLQLTPAKDCDKSILLETPEDAVPCPFVMPNPSHHAQMDIAPLLHARLILHEPQPWRENQIALRECKTNFSFRKKRPSFTRKREMRKRPRIAARQDCWFCLSSPACEQHLLISVGEQIYLTLPKGGLTNGHTLLVPIEHVDRIESQLIVEEMQKYKELLRRFHGQFHESVFFCERSVATTGAHRHAFVEAIPIPSHMEGEIKAALLKQGEAAGLTLRPTSSEGVAASHYVKFELADGSAYVHVEKEGRTKNATSLCEACRVRYSWHSRKGDWKACVLPRETETKIANDFRTGFEKFLN